VKVLLDEQLPHRLRHHLGAHHVFTADYISFGVATRVAFAPAWSNSCFDFL
jgi:hypothetical protein